MQRKAKWITRIARRGGLGWLAIIAVIMTPRVIACDQKDGETPISGRESVKVNRTIPPPNEGFDLMVVAHRACWREAPENSLLAMDICIDRGVDMVEIDVRQTKDGHLVVIHDETVDRTTNGTGFVRDFTLAYIQALQLREGAGGKDSNLTDQSVPSLREALRRLDGKVLINLDAKEAIREATVALVREEGMEDQIVIKAIASSPRVPLLQSATYLESISFMPIIHPDNGDLADQVASFEGEFIEAFEIIYKSEDRLRDSCIKAKRLVGRVESKVS